MKRLDPLDEPNHDLDLPFAAGPRVRQLADYAGSGQVLAEEQLLGVAGARVLFANYGAIRADFGALWGKPHGTDEQAAIDRWLLRNAAFISTSQTAAQGINTPIVLDGRRVAAWRPPRYGRAGKRTGAVRHQGHRRAAGRSPGAALLQRFADPGRSGA